jgi:hypothetical protein
MRAERSIPQPRDVFKVIQWKDNIDPTEPWWKRAYFRYLFLPFQNFSFKLGIPAVKEVTVESDEKGNVRRTFRWCEDQGVFDTEEQADAGCLAERWGYTKLPYGRLVPPDSAQYDGGTIYPRKKNPKRWTQPTLSLIVKDRIKEEHEQQALSTALTRLNQVLDRQ